MPLVSSIPPKAISDFLFSDAVKLKKKNYHNLNPLKTTISHYIETSQLICTVNQLTGFYMMGNIGR